MAMDATMRRRWFGAVVLLSALAMLILGDTVFKGRLSGLGYLLYWLGCFALTALAMAVAFMDARALQSRARQEQRDLLEKTFRIENSRDKSKPEKRNDTA